MTTTPVRSEHRSTFEDSNPPAIIPIVLRFANVLHRMKLLPVKFDRESLREAALKAAKASTFDAQVNWDGLEVLGKASLNQSHLTYMARASLRSEVLRQLRLALQLEAYTRENPAAANEPIVRPIFITGLPRTGTTLLHRLMARDPQMRAPRLWELISPIPSQESEKRLHTGEGMVRQMLQFIPKFPTIHPMAADDPEECFWLLMQCYSYIARGALPEYEAWLDTYDHRPEYARYRRYLQVMQFRQPTRRWVLKSPFHLFALDAIADAFPGAIIVFTHRSPATVIPSWASFVSTTTKALIDETNLKANGRLWADLWHKGLTRADAVRQSTKTLQFVDVFYGDIVSNPVETVKEVYEKLQQPWTNDADAQMKDWLRDNARGKFQEHRYSLEQFGLTKEDIDKQYSAYIKRYRLGD